MNTLQRLSNFFFNKQYVRLYSKKGAIFVAPAFFKDGYLYSSHPELNENELLSGGSLFCSRNFRKWEPVTKKTKKYFKKQQKNSCEIPSKIRVQILEVEKSKLESQLTMQNQTIDLLQSRIYGLQRCSISLLDRRVGNNEYSLSKANG